MTNPHFNYDGPPGPGNIPRDRHGHPLYIGCPVDVPFIEPGLWCGDGSVYGHVYNDNFWLSQNGVDTLIVVKPRPSCPWHSIATMIYVFNNVLDASPAYNAVPIIEHGYLKYRARKRRLAGHAMRNGDRRRPALPDSIVMHTLNLAGVCPTRHEIMPCN